MDEIIRVALLCKLHPRVYTAWASATVFCRTRGKSYGERFRWFVRHFQRPVPGASDDDVACHFDSPST